MPDEAPPAWTLGRYVRVFGSLQADYPEVWADDHLLAWYVRLLSIADATWPAAAPWPRALPSEVEEALVETGSIRAQGPAYQVAGLDHLRSLDARVHRARVQGGRNRAAGAPRDDRGRLVPVQVTPGDLDQESWSRSPSNGSTPGDLVSPGDSRTRTVVPGRPGDLVAVPGVQDLQVPDQTRPDDGGPPGPPSSGFVETGEQRARRLAAGSGAPIACDDYRAHQSQHVQIAGAWRCLACERRRAEEAAQAGEPSFRDKVAQAGGWTPGGRPDDERPF